MHRLPSLVLFAIGCTGGDPAAGDAAGTCDPSGASVGCADLDGEPQDCPGEDYEQSGAHVAWTATGGFHDADGLTLVLGPGDRDVVLVIEVPGGLSGTGEVPLDDVNATAWDVSDPDAPVPYAAVCGGGLRIDAYTPGESGSVAGWTYLYLGADAASCASWPPEVQIGAEFDVGWVDPTCQDLAAEDGGDGSDGADGADGSDGTDGTDGTDGADGADGTDGSDGADGTDDCPGTPTVGCMDPAHGCPDYGGTFDATELGPAWWEGVATATATSVGVVSADGRAMTAGVTAPLEPGRTYSLDEVAVSVTGADGVVRDRVCGGVLVVDDATTATEVTGGWLWYIDTTAGDCAVWGDVLQTSGRFTAAPVCE